MTKDEPLRVLLAVEPGIDGVFRCVENLVRYLLKQRVQVHLAYSSKRGGPALRRLVEDVRAAGGQTLDLYVGNSPGPRDALALWRLRRLALTCRPHVIHGHSSKAGALVRILSYVGVRAPTFYTPHAYYRMHQPLNAKGRILMSIERMLGRVGTTMHVSGSELAYGRELLRLRPERQIIRANGVDCTRFSPAPPEERARLRAGFGWPVEAPVLGTVARYSLQKDPQTLYAAVFAALEADPDWHFAHLGDGVLRPEIDALIAAHPHRARIHQIASMAEPHTFYQALDGFILPSRYEGLALAALEALSVGLPMILTDCPGNDDLQHYGLDAIQWTPPGDAAANAAAIVRWAQNQAVVGASNHRRIALEAFEGQGCYEKILATYRAAAAAHI